MPRHHRILALSLLLTLAACGGGGDGGTGTASLDSAALTPPAAQPQNETYAATLSGAEQVPPRITSAQGSGSITVTASTRQMTATVNVVGMTAISVNLYQGAPGSTGPIILALVETVRGSGVWTGRTTLSVAEHASLRAGQFYFSAASAAFASGEIRGQIGLRAGTSGIAPAPPSIPATTATTGSAPLR